MLHPSEQAIETQLPLPSQVWRILSLSVQRASVPEHSLQLPPMQTGVLPLHALPVTHALPTQNSGVLPSLQRLCPLVQPQVPFVHTGVSAAQGAASCHACSALQSCGVPPAPQRLSPTLHATHCPLKQTGVLPEHAPAARFSHWPEALQNCGVAWLHWAGVPFGAHTPVQALPMQNLPPGHAAAVPHCPFVVHVCNWKSAVHLFAFGAHCPTQAAGPESATHA